MNTKESVDLIESALHESVEVARQNAPKARFSIERLDGKPRRPKEPCVKLRAYSGDKQAYLLYIGSVDGERIERKTYDGKFLRGDELSPDSIDAIRVIADVTLFSAGVVAAL